MKTIEIKRYEPQKLALYVGGTVLLLIVLLSWVAPRGAPLATPSEARYARVSQDMAQRDIWIVPYFKGEARVKKPPLLHWIHRGMHAVLGEKDVLASRSISMLGWSLTVLLVFWFGWRIRDQTTGLIAAIVLASSIYTLYQSRMAIIDPIMAPFWALATFAGFLMFYPHRAERGHWGGLKSGESKPLHQRAVIRNWYQTPGIKYGSEPAFWSWIWALVFWGAILVNYSFKGPQALLPLLPVILYALLTHKLAVLRKLSFWLMILAGLVVSAIPLLVWAGIVIVRYPDAAEVWYNETIGRMTGRAPSNSTHGGRPLGYNWGLLLACLFPALLFLPIPGIHVGKRLFKRVRRWRAMKEKSRWHDLPVSLKHTWRHGHLGMYLLLSVLAPMVFYSLFKMRAPNYIFMFTPMVAIGAALSFRSWLDIQDDFKVLKGKGIDYGAIGPNPVMAIAIVMGVLAVSGLSAGIWFMVKGKASAPEQALFQWSAAYFIPALFLLNASIRWRVGKRRPEVLIVIAIAVITFSVGTIKSIDQFRTSLDKRGLLQAAETDAAGQNYELHSWGDSHTDLNFYRGSDIPQWKFGRDRRNIPTIKPGERRYVLIREGVDKKLGEDYELTEHFVIIQDQTENWPAWLIESDDFTILARQIGPLEQEADTE